jgi:hypothetical protein
MEEYNQLTDPSPSTPSPYADGDDAWTQLSTGLPVRLDR